MIVDPGISRTNKDEERTSKERDTEIPYIHLKKNNSKYTIILFHANAEDIFGIEYVAEELRANFKVLKRNLLSRWRL